jgi:phage tail sheath gpL-like
VSGSPVSAKADGDTITLTSKTVGAAGNITYSVTDSSDFTVTPGSGSLSGGTNSTTTTEYDAGSVDATVGSITASSQWEKTGTAETIAKGLASSLNASSKGAFKATASGSAVTITPASGTSAPSVAVSVKDGMGFNPASFSASTEN